MVSSGGIRKLPGYENHRDTKTTEIQKLPEYENYRDTKTTGIRTKTTAI
jgi:hypothetical protein